MLTVTGIFDLGNKSANSRLTYISLRNAQSIFDLTGGATVIDVVMHDVYQAEVVAQEIHLQTGLQADSWMKTNEQFFTAVKAQTTANTAIRFFVGLSVGFGIASVLVVSVVQRSREIGIMRAMGVTRGQILRIFLLQGGLLGLGGALLGLPLVLRLCRCGNTTCAMPTAPSCSRWCLTPHCFFTPCCWPV